MVKLAAMPVFPGNGYAALLLVYMLNRQFLLSWRFG